MRYLAIALAGTLVTAALATPAVAERPGTLAEATRGKHHGSHVSTGGLGEARMRRHSSSPQLSPHFGLPGFSGLGSPQISPHIGLPGFSGLPQPDGRSRHGFRGGHHDSDFEFVGYWGEYDSDGYADTIPGPDQFGYFSTGGHVTMDGDKPVYNYDRSYPYDWYGGTPRATARSASTGTHCQIHTVWDEEERKQVPVRVCEPY